MQKWEKVLQKREEVEQMAQTIWLRWEETPQRYRYRNIYHKAAPLIAVYDIARGPFSVPVCARRCRTCLSCVAGGVTRLESVEDGCDSRYIYIELANASMTHPRGVCTAVPCVV